MKDYVRALCRVLKAIAEHPWAFAQVVKTAPSICAAHAFSTEFKNSVTEETHAGLPPSNPLWEYFEGHREGPGIWKWNHYFDAYHRHLARFVGRKVDVLEVGIYSGGSLQMWRSYFGRDSQIYGVDIEAACRVYENDDVSVFIGDQEDRSFWRAFRDSVGGLDVIIDDGGHTPEQQQVTLQEMLPYLRPGGVYLCEDVHGVFNRFAAFAAGLVDSLNAMNDPTDSPRETRATPFQAAVHSIHFYPYLVVIEKHSVSPEKLAVPKHGTEWQPFYG